MSSPIIKPDPDDELAKFEPHNVAMTPHDAPMATRVKVQAEMTVETKLPEFLPALISTSDPELLEKGVVIGVDVLKSLKQKLACFQDAADTQAGNWLQGLEELESRAMPTRTIIGVVGATGTGKSSVISAVLDEERLLPTNCMRACTASATELSYNYSEKPDELYRAEVEFITASDWSQELQVLYSDLLDSNGNVSRECTNADTEAGVAYDKIKAVYPKMTKENLARCNPAELANLPSVRHILGTTKRLKATTAAHLYCDLQAYVDSKEKNTKEIEFWPLIKCVRIFTKAAALSTGACLVDLPGVQDSNAARAAVAANYMKNLTGLWIVAPITRAVDDKTAKHLLGDSFRRQLKYDGNHSAVTFICSKTDDISVTEAAESLGFESQISDSWLEILKMGNEIDRLKRTVSQLKEEKEQAEDGYEEADRAIEKWEDLGTDVSQGKTVYAPTKASKKRKRTSKPSGSRKNLYPGDSDDSSDSEYSGDSNKENGKSDTDERRDPLTKEQIEAEVASLRGQKKSLRQVKKDLDAKMKLTRQKIAEIEATKQSRLSIVKSICIQGRNVYSRTAIRADFAQGIKELDQETAAAQDEANFNPEVDLRDYNAVAASLPVFCVSSRAFQKFRGRLRKDNFNNEGFLNVEETEIPKLQEHARKLTEGGRIAQGRRFLTDLSQLINSMTIWAANDGRHSKLSPGEKMSDEEYIKQLLGNLEHNLDVALEECVKLTEEAITENVCQVSNKSIRAASEAAVPTAAGWGAHRGQGGLLWATYKATTRRYGVFTGASGARDFNTELFKPLSKHLAGGWDRAFHVRLPAIFEGFARTLKSLFRDFHGDSTSRYLERGANLASVNLLSQRLQNFQQRISELPGQIRATYQDQQKEASRAFCPAIAKSMVPAYEQCNSESGPGSFARMKDAMISHVERHRTDMFDRATEIVWAQLHEMCMGLEHFLKDNVRDMFDSVRRDYVAALVGSEESSLKGMPRAERLLREEMHSILLNADHPFSELADQLGMVHVAAQPETPHSRPLTAVAEPGSDRQTEVSDPDSSDEDDDDALIAAQLKPDPDDPGAHTLSQMS